MGDERVLFDFSQRAEEEQALLLQHTWCDSCQQADLGMRDPVEYEQAGVRIVEGCCNQCGEPVFTELTDDEF